MLTLWCSTLLLPDVSFVCTDACFRGRGAASTLMSRVLALAAADGLPVYLESTVEAAGLYRRLGFAAVDGFHMALPGGKVYDEVCMLWSPPAEAAAGPE